FEPVLVVHFFRRRQIDSGVTELERLRSGSKGERTSRVHGLTIGEDALDDDRRCGRGKRAVRLDHGHALGSREPELPGAGLPGNRLRAAVALAAGHTIASTVRDAGDFRSKTFGKIIELLTRYAEDSFVAAHPEVAGAVFQNREDAVIEKSFARG